GRFDLAGDPVTLPAHEHLQQTLEQLRLIRGRNDRSQVAQILRRIEEGDLVPGRKVMEQMRWHWQALLAQADVVAEVRHHLIDAEASIEIGAADVDSGAAKNVRAAIDVLCPLRRQAGDHEIGSAAAKVYDQRELFPIQRLLVGKGRCDRLELRLHMAKTL